MTDLTSNLTIRIKLTPAAAPQPAPEGKYRWDRIAMVATLAFITVGILVFKLSQTPAQPTVLTNPVHMAAPSVTTEIAVEPVAPAKEVIEDAAPVAAIPTQASTIEIAPPRSAELPAAVQEALPNQQTDTATGPLTPAQTAIVSSRVKRLLITDGVKSNEPQGDISDIRQRSKVKGLLKIYAYSEVQNLQGETLHYRWLHSGKLIADVKIKVRSNSWRSHASKYLNNQMRGNWRVELKTSEGELLAFTEFVYQ
jgi:hypothetical protein